MPGGNEGNGSSDDRISFNEAAADQRRKLTLYGSAATIVATACFNEAAPDQGRK